jgi:hypothetical protein
MANTSILKNEEAKTIRLSTLEAICRALDCQPGDILEYRKQQRMQLYIVSTAGPRQDKRLASKLSFHDEAQIEKRGAKKISVLPPGRGRTPLGCRWVIRVERRFVCRNDSPFLGCNLLYPRLKKANV